MAGPPCCFGNGNASAATPRRGFTLLELLIALAVLAAISLVIYGHGSSTVLQLRSMEERTLARWVAENQLAKLRLERALALAKANESAAGESTADESDTQESAAENAGQPTVGRIKRASSDRGSLSVGTRREEFRQGDRTWRVKLDTRSTSDPALFRVEVSVFSVEAGREVGPLDTLTAFIGRY